MAKYVMVIELELPTDEDGLTDKGWEMFSELENQIWKLKSFSELENQIWKLKSERRVAVEIPTGSDFGSYPGQGHGYTA